MNKRNFKVILIGFLMLMVSSDAGLYRGSDRRKHSVQTGTEDCRRVTCQTGEVCINNDSGLPECICVQSCSSDHLKPTCGSDKKWYESHCHLHQTACLTNTKISVLHDNECFNRVVTCFGINKKTFKGRIIEHYKGQFKHPQHSQKSTTDSKVTKNLLLGLIFNHYDIDQDEIISTNEVLVSMTRDMLHPISTQCTMLDILMEHEADGDDRWSNEEFYEAFGVGGYSLEESFQTKETIVTAGDRVILGCDIQGDTPLDIVWTRNDVALDTLMYVDGIQMFGDGHLYFTPVKSIHAGNYTCSIRGRLLPRQKYTVRVNVAPTIRACPENQISATGKAAKFYCKAWGIPQPDVSWQRNGLRLRKNEVTEFNNRTLTIIDAKIENSGKFICSAKNDIGTNEVVAVLVEEQAILSHDPLRSLFYVFHKFGITAINPVTCTAHNNKQYKDMIPNTNEKVCNIFNKTTGQFTCVWGGSVNVRNRFIYVTQPTENKILVLAIGNEQIVEYINMKTGPISLQYVEHLDQVWVVSSAKKEKANTRIVQIIPDASKFRAHHVIHMEPSNHHYDSVRSLYIPPEQIPGQGFFEYGFAHHNKELGLDKIDLKSKRKVSTLKLVSHGCIPYSLAYISFGGYLVVNCENSDTGKQIIIDYITEKVVSVNENIKGVPKVSPNGEFLVSIDYNQGAIFVQTVSLLGQVEQHFEIRANIIISDVVFFPSVARESYDMLLIPKDKSEALFVDLRTGALKVMTINGQPMNVDDLPKNEHNQRVISDGLLEGYIATPMEESLFILDTKKQKMHCNIKTIKYGNVIQPVTFC